MTDEKEEEIARFLRDTTDDFFADRSAEDRAIYRKALSLATEIVGAWQDLYPALSMPPNALDTLEEMIWREVWGTFTPHQDKPLLSAYDLAHDRLYINNAIRAGLRHGEPLQPKPEDEPDEAGPIIRGLPNGGTKH